jgi:hypothetical protein
MTIDLHDDREDNNENVVSALATLYTVVILQQIRHLTPSQEVWESIEEKIENPQNRHIYIVGRARIVYSFSDDEGDEGGEGAEGGEGGEGAEGGEGGGGNNNINITMMLLLRRDDDEWHRSIRWRGEEEVNELGDLEDGVQVIDLAEELLPILQQTLSHEEVEDADDENL